MSDAAGFERTLWPGKEPVLIALVAASAGFASLGASDLIALTDEGSPAQPGNLQSALPVPAFGAAAENVETAPAPAREESSQAPARPTALPLRIEPAITEPAPAQAMAVEPMAAEAGPVQVPTALPPSLTATVDQPSPAPVRETVDVAFAEFRMPDAPAAPIATPDTVSVPQPDTQPVAQSLAASATPTPEVAVLDLSAPEALAESTGSLPEPATQSPAAAPPVFEGPPLILARIQASGPAMPARIEPLPEIALLDTAPPDAVPAALAAGPEEIAPPTSAPLPEAPATSLAAGEPAPPAPLLPSRTEALDTAAHDSAALAEWTRSVRQVGGWSLAQAADTSAADAPTAQAGNAPSPAFRDAPLAARKHRLTGRGIEFALPVVMEGRAPAWVPLLIDAEQNVCVRIADLLALIQPMLPPETFSRLSAAKGAQEFVSLRELRLQGIDFRYDAPRNRLVLGEVASASRAPRMALRGQ